MVTLAATTGAAENEEIRRFLAGCRRADLEILRRRIARGVTDGDLPPGTGHRHRAPAPGTGHRAPGSLRLARFVNAVAHGMSLQARDGADQSALEQVADCAIAAWDSLVRA